MKLVNLTVEQFVNEVDSKSPAPGGGSVSALASSMGVALTKMVGHLTVGKKKFKALEENIQTDFNHRIDSLTAIKEELVELIDKDTDAFNLIMAAFKLPKETVEEKKERSRQIELGTLEAIKVPYRVMELSMKALEELDFVLQYGNKNCLSDLAVSAIMLQGGLEGAILNVKINLPGVSDEKVKEFYVAETDKVLTSSRVLRDTLVTKIHNSL